MTGFFQIALTLVCFFILFGQQGGQAAASAVANIKVICQEQKTGFSTFCK